MDAEQEHIRVSVKIVSILMKKERRYAMNWKRKMQIRVWINAWIEIVAGIVKILTLAYWRPSWSFQYICWSTKRDFKKKEEDNE
jgi:hypothetical protein